MAEPNSLNTAINIFASPNEAFASIKGRPTVLLPMLLACIGAAAVGWLYSIEVDIGWLTEQQLRSQTLIDLTEAQIQTMAAAAADRSRTGTVVQSVLGGFLAIPIIYLLQALYLKIVSLFTKDAIHFKQWLSLVSWTSLPSVLGSIATIVFILTNDVSFVDQTGINPLSFTNLLQLDSSESSTFVRVASNAGPINLWSLILGVLGYRVISGSGIGKAVAVILTPIIVIAAVLYIVS